LIIFCHTHDPSNVPPAIFTSDTCRSDNFNEFRYGFRISISRNGGYEVGEVGKISGFVEDGVKVWFEVSEKFSEVVRFECPVGVLAP
jgi:hypothetical protein